MIPIQKIKLTPNNTDTINDVTINISIDCNIYGKHEGVNIECLSKYLEYQINNWSDGRYSFSSEMFRNGLESNIKKAIQDCIDVYYQKLYKNQMVDRGNSSTAKWYIESNKHTQDVSCYVKDSVQIKINEQI